jgi:hypothetical protein
LSLNKMLLSLSSSTLFCSVFTCWMIFIATYNHYH